MVRLEAQFQGFVERQGERAFEAICNAGRAGEHVVVELWKDLKCYFSGQNITEYTLKNDFELKDYSSLMKTSDKAVNIEPDIAKFDQTGTLLSNFITTSFCAIPNVLKAFRNLQHTNIDKTIAKAKEHYESKIMELSELGKKGLSDDEKTTANKIIGQMETMVQNLEACKGKPLTDEYNNLLALRMKAIDLQLKNLTFGVKIRKISEKSENLVTGLRKHCVTKACERLKKAVNNHKASVIEKQTQRLSKQLEKYTKDAHPIEKFQKGGGAKICYQAKIYKGLEIKPQINNNFIKGVK